MPIAFVCVKCGKNYTVDRSLAGKTAKCKACSATMKDPDAGAEAPEGETVG